MYADRETDAIRYAISETNRRRALQQAYNEAHGITPATVVKAILDMSPTSGARDYYAVPKLPKDAAQVAPEMDLSDRIEALRLEMFAAAENLEFEKAAKIRDQIRMLRGEGLGEDGSGNGRGATNGASTRGKPAGRPARKARPQNAARAPRGRYR